jgi:phage shock protein C
MHSPHGSLFTRPDTFFGVCEAIGEDLGIHANWLRAGLAVSVLFAPKAAVIVYLVAGAIALATRLIFPAPVAAVVEAAVSPAATAEAEPLRLDYAEAA